MLGILIGTAAVIMLVAVGTGISNQVQAQITRLGTNAIYVSLERNRGGQDRGGTVAHQVQLTRADVTALENRTALADVAAVAPSVEASGTVTWAGTTYTLGKFVGTTPVYGQIRNAWVHRGRWLSDEDQRTHAKAAVIGTTVVEHLFASGVDPVGQQVQFNGVAFRIVGLLEHKGSNGFSDQDDVIFAPLSTVLDDIVGNVDTYNNISVEAVSQSQVRAAMGEVTTTLRHTHHLRAGDALDFRVINAADRLAAGKAAAHSFQILLATVACISLLIGGIGVMNIMLVTVTERTREIGIRKALGAQKSDILTQFLAEAILLAGLGGIIGIAVGIGAGHLQLGGTKAVISPGSVLLSFTVSVLIGVFFGAYPAGRAAALTPIDALRYE
jgi:putative ABC transport system permease protein